jgi:hypothetical protein
MRQAQRSVGSSVDKDKKKGRGPGGPRHKERWCYSSEQEKVGNSLRGAAPAHVQG